MSNILPSLLQHLMQQSLERPGGYGSMEGLWGQLKMLIYIIQHINKGAIHPSLTFFVAMLVSLMQW
jgi:hypothetical protein